MKWPQFGVYDFFIILAYCILNFYLFGNWHSFNCQEPLNVWLALDYSLLLLIRIIIVIRNSEYSERTVNICNVFFYTIIFPIAVTWSVIGVIWYQGGLSCIPEDLVPWSFVLWLVITVMASFIMLVDLIYDLHQYRKLRKFIKRIDEVDQPFLQGTYQKQGNEVEIKVVPYSLK